MSRLGLILLAGGSSQRFENEKLKQLLPVSQKPLFLYTLDRLTSCIDFKDVVVVLHPSIEKPADLKIAPGGDSWLDSVFQGFETLDPGLDKILVHDAARPFFLVEDLLRLVDEAKKHKLVALGSKMRNTLIKIEKPTMKVVDRSDIWEIYTPQIANRELFNLDKSAPCTDLMTFALHHGIQGKILPSSPINIKITYPEDALICNYLAIK